MTGVPGSGSLAGPAPAWLRGLVLARLGARLSLDAAAGVGASVVLLVALIIALAVALAVVAGRIAGLPQPLALLLAVHVAGSLILVAVAAIGLSTPRDVLWRAGRRPIVVGLALSAVVSLIAFLLVVATGAFAID